MEMVMVSRLQGMVEILCKQELKPMKRHLLQLVSLHSQLICW